MGNGNGDWTRWLVGTLWGCVLLAITTIATNVVANDKDSRSRDDKLEEKVNTTIIQQKDVNQAILISLAELKTDISYIKKNVDKM